MREILVHIQKPIWGGGKPKIGVADFRVNGADIIKVKIDYARKDGRESYPDVYKMLATKLVTYPVQVVGGGVKLYVAPLQDWEVEQPFIDKPAPKPIEEPVKPTNEQQIFLDVPKVYKRNNGFN